MAKRTSGWSWAACTMAVAAIASSPCLAAIQSIEKYCQKSWANAGIHQQDWGDCTNQALLELIEEITTERLPLAAEDERSFERQSLKRSIWRVIQRQRRAPQFARCDEYRFPQADGNGVDHGLWQEVLAAAKRRLTTQQWQVLTLLHEGWKIGEIADLLGIKRSRVSDEKYRAIRKLNKHFGERKMA